MTVFHEPDSAVEISISSEAKISICPILCNSIIKHNSKPTDASDIKILNDAKAEIRELRSALQLVESSTDYDFFAKSEKIAWASTASQEDQDGWSRQGVLSANNLEYVKKTVSKSEETRNLILDSIKQSTLFQRCTPVEFSDIVDAFQPVYASADSVVIQQGDEDSEDFYVVQDGTLEISTMRAGNKRILPPLQQGSSFGELALLFDKPRSATITASVDCKLWMIDRKTFRSIQQYHKLNANNLSVDLLKNVTVGGNNLEEVLTLEQFNDLVSVLDTEFFPKGEVIIHEGMTGDTFYIIESGTVDVFMKSKGKDPVRTLQSSDYFGQLVLLSEDVRTATCVASSDVKCLFLVRSDFVRLFGGMQDVLVRKSYKSDFSDQSKRVSKVFSWALSDLEVKRTIGKGGFGRVKLVKMNSKYYALKCLAKCVVVQRNLKGHIINENKMLASLDHPFIFQFYGAFQDKTYIYFLTEFLVGGELYTLLKKKKTFEENEVQFYSACVISAFKYMHAQKIAFRDLKPENLVLDALGYVKIIDFGFAKKIEGKAWTVCGTPDYIAPEIIGNEGHDWAVDYWSLGVLIFELKMGKAPFKGSTSIEKFEAIRIGRFSMPLFLNKNVADIIRKLLKANPSKRLGKTKGGVDAIMAHKFFRKFDWDALDKQTLIPPYQHLNEDPEKASNFKRIREDDRGVVPCPEWNPKEIKMV